MPSLFDYLERAFVGPIMTQKDFHMKVLIPNVRRIVKEYDIAYDPENPVSVDDALADRLFAAVFWRNTNRPSRFRRSTSTEKHIRNCTT